MRNLESADHVTIVDPGADGSSILGDGRGYTIEQDDANSGRQLGEMVDGETRRFDEMPSEDSKKPAVENRLLFAVDEVPPWPIIILYAFQVGRLI